MNQDKTKRQLLLEFFQRIEPILKDEDHPELKDGASAWVRKMRAENEARIQRIQKQRNRK
jgi:hypothetical protein